MIAMESIRMTFSAAAMGPCGSRMFIGGSEKDAATSRQSPRRCASRPLRSSCKDDDFVIRFRRDAGDGGNHGCEGDFGKEVCCAAERRGTRASRRADTQGQERGAAAAEGADIIEGRRFRRR